MTATAGQVHVLGLGESESLTYTVRHTSRRRTVGIFVEPNGQVAVLAPPAAAMERIEQILRRRMRWIRRKQRTVEALPSPPQPREWVAGETHRYLGRQYRLKLAKGSPSNVKLLGGYFVVTTPDPKNRDQVRELMEDWYKAHAIALLTDRVERAIASSTWLRMKTPSIRIRNLKSRWGSTTAKGSVTFNVDLAKLSLSCIDYVVVHELVHLIIPSHSPAFWRMVARVMPDWRRWQAKLAIAEA